MQTDASREFADLQAQLRSQAAELEKQMAQHPLSGQVAASIRAVLADMAAHLKDTQTLPPENAPLCVHLIGLNKTQKSSFLLELFDCDALCALIRPPEDMANQFTARPCCVEPCDSVTEPELRVLDWQSGRETQITRAQFEGLYALDYGGADFDGGQLLRIRLPRKDCKCNLTIYEYPGIKGAPYANDQERKRHEVFERDMTEVLSRWPGLLVVCFGTAKPELPDGHPFERLIGKYYRLLGATRLPLLFSMHSNHAVLPLLCGKTEFKQLLEENLGGTIPTPAGPSRKILEVFDISVQIVNPKPDKYPIPLDRSATEYPSVMDYVPEKIAAKDYFAEILRDGGVALARRFIVAMLEKPELRVAVHRLIYGPWNGQATKLLNNAASWRQEMERRTYRSQVEDIVRRRLLATDRPLPTFRQIALAAIKEAEAEQAAPTYQAMCDFWAKVFKMYYEPYVTHVNAKLDAACRELAVDLVRFLNGDQERIFMVNLDNPMKCYDVMLNNAELLAVNSLLRPHETLAAALLAGAA